jgi:hypothetical protein
MFDHSEQAAPKPAAPAAATATKTTCPTCKKQHRGACRYAAPTSVPADILSNEELAARDPAFAAALAAGMLLDEEELDEIALIDLDEKIADLELEEEDSED